LMTLALLCGIFTQYHVPMMRMHFVLMNT
jgi:hypothetical protein